MKRTSLVSISKIHVADTINSEVQDYPGLSCLVDANVAADLGVSLPVPVWQQSLGGQQHTATREPIPPSLSSDWSYLSGCQVSLPDKYKELAFAVSMATASTSKKKKKSSSDL